MKLIDRVRLLLYSRRPGPLSESQRRLAEELRASVASLPVPDPSSTASPAEAEWLGNRRRLRELIQREDPRRFLAWDVIGKTMFVGDFPYVKTELSALREDPQWADRWSHAIREDPAGSPMRSRWKLDSSGNAIHHAYSLWRLERETGARIGEFDQIVEFGGGYGSLCRVAHRLGFRGKYVIFDLPEFGALQRYYLSSVGLRVAEAPQAGAVCCLSDFDRLREQTRDARGKSLFIALWSLSETPLSLRRALEPVISSLSHALIGYQARFGEVDNAAYFGELASQRPDRVIRPIEHTPGHYYLFGGAPAPAAPNR
jgi:hypothetical protein